MAIKNGDTVKVHYTGSLADGTIFDTSRDREPLEFTMGKKMLIAGFEAALMDKQVGDKVSVTIPPDQGYGDADPELVFTVDRAHVPAEITPEVGMQLQLSNEEGTMDVTIIEVGEDSITLDANHMLAGKTLTFDIEVMDVK